MGLGSGWRSLRVAAWVGFGLVASPLIAREIPAAFLMRGNEVSAPRGFVDMCRTTTDFCTRQLVRTAAFAGRGDVDDALKMLNRLNRYVNSRVEQRTDVQMYGREEVWRRSGVGPHARGDCEDIALEKRHQLIAEGFPADRLFFAEVYSREAGLHAILVARTDEGDYALDNRTPYVRRWSEAGYSWISVQSVEDPMVWNRVA